MAEIDELNDDAVFLRVTWKKAFNFHTTFVQRFAEVKARLDKGEFPGWTSAKFLSLKCGLNENQIIKMALVYSRVMGDEERQMLEEQAAKAAQQRQQARLEAINEQRRLRAETQRQRELLEAQKRADKQAKADAQAGKLAEAKRREAEKKTAARRRANRERYAANRLRKQQEAVSAGQDVMSKLAAQIKAGQLKAQQGRAAWIQGTMEQAVALAEARARFPGNSQFSDWLIQNDISYGADERAALINMGMNAQITLSVLEMTERTSIELIWKREVSPKVKEIHLRNAPNMDSIH